MTGAIGVLVLTLVSRKLYSWPVKVHVQRIVGLWSPHSFMWTPKDGVQECTHAQKEDRCAQALKYVSEP